MHHPLLVSLLGAPASGRDTLMTDLVQALQATGLCAVVEHALERAQRLPSARRFGAYLDRRLMDLAAQGVQVVVTDAPFLWPMLDGQLNPDEASPDALAYLTELHQATAQQVYLVPPLVRPSLSPGIQTLHATTFAFTRHLRAQLGELDVPFTELAHPVDVLGKLVRPIQQALLMAA